MFACFIVFKGSSQTMFDVGEIVEQKYIVVQLYYIEKYIEESSCFMQLFQQSNLLHYFLMFAI